MTGGSGSCDGGAKSVPAEAPALALVSDSFWKLPEPAGGAEYWPVVFGAYAKSRCESPGCVGRMGRTVRLGGSHQVVSQFQSTSEQPAERATNRPHPIRLNCSQGCLKIRQLDRMKPSSRGRVRAKNHALWPHPQVFNLGNCTDPAAGGSGGENSGPRRVPRPVRK